MVEPCFNVFHELAPQYLNQHFIRVADSHSYRTRGSLFNFIVPCILCHVISN